MKQEAKKPEVLHTHALPCLKFQTCTCHAHSHDTIRDTCGSRRGIRRPFSLDPKREALNPGLIPSKYPGRHNAHAPEPSSGSTGDSRWVLEPETQPEGTWLVFTRASHLPEFWFAFDFRTRLLPLVTELTHCGFSIQTFSSKRPSACL